MIRSRAGFAQETPVASYGCSLKTRSVPLAKDNYFNLVATSNISSISFNYNNDIQYTSGEDFDGVTVTGATNQVTIDVEVDRKASTSPAT